MARRRVSKEPLRSRLPTYLRSFGLGVVAALVSGLLIWLFTPAGWVSSIGYTYIVLGTAVMLAGAARGGGYTNLGVGRIGSLATGAARMGRRSFTGRAGRHLDVQTALEMEEDSAAEEPEERGSDDAAGRRDPMARLRKGLRPEENPDAFWQTLAGIAYVGVGTAVTTVFA